jgi:hypothetical protein
MPRFGRTSLVPFVAFLPLGCSGEPDLSSVPRGPSVDVASPLYGVPDPQADPPVVALDMGGSGLCGAVLVAPDVVLTARRCVDVVSAGLACPPDAGQTASSRSPSTIRVLVGDDLSSAVERARGFELLEPEGTDYCAADLAFIVLDATIDDRLPIRVRATTPATGDHLRTVGFDAERKVVRDNVAVTDATPRGLLLGEAPCRVAPGGPAIDESTGELVGILSRSDPGCSGAGAVDVFMRLDGVAGLLEQALAFASTRSAPHAAREVKGPVDMGANCDRGKDCAAGVCVSYQGDRYCSRSCAPQDKCPTHFRCMQGQQGSMACVKS